MVSVAWKKFPYLFQQCVSSVGQTVHVLDSVTNMRFNKMHFRLGLQCVLISMTSNMAAREEDKKDNFSESGILSGRVCKISKSDYFLRHVCLSVRLELGRPLEGISRYLSIFLKSVEKIRVSLLCDMDGWYFA